MRRGTQCRAIVACGALLLAATAAAPAAAPGASAWRVHPRVGPGLPAGLFEAAAEEAYGEGGGIPRDRLIEMVQRRFNARVVRVNLVESDGRRVYEMRLMSEQRVWNVRVDADTGQVIDGG